MNAYERRILILVAIAMSIVALFSYRLLPEKRYLATADHQASVYLHSIALPTGDKTAQWLNKSERRYRCIYSDKIPSNTYYCSFNIGLSFNNNTGMDLSRYRRINVFVEYNGTAPKMRLFVRNYNNAYSTPGDFNSTKYNAIYLASHDLREEVSLNISEFVVSEWWLMAYNIPREQSFPELNNAVSLGLSFSDSMTVGNHDVKVNKIEFVGEWISKEYWYLLIIGTWLIGVFVDTVNQLRLLRKQHQSDTHIIQELNKTNQNLLKESKKFRKLSTVDALTQAYNRFGVDQIISTLIASSTKAARNKPPLALILIDIDLFKYVNDQRGHDVGDRVLKQVASIIKKNVRNCDYIGRWGGEEFVIILPFTSHDFAFAMAEKIRILVSLAEFEPDHPITITVSSGVGSMLAGEDFPDIFKRVDEALYRAKASGRNCCCLASPQTLKQP